MMNPISNQYLPVNSNGQLYHIVRTDNFAICLICLEDVINTVVDIGKHSDCANHQESVRRLFQACNQNVVIDSDERFMDLVSRSVLDISVLLGEETSYICDKGGSWFCLMCEQTITSSKTSDTTVKDKLIDHVLSEMHVKETKGVCFLYRLNSDQDFLLLHKSIVYCSVCKEVIQCREVDLLNVAVVHIETKKHKVIKSFGQDESNCFVKKEQNVEAHDKTTSRSCNNSQKVLINNLVNEVKGKIIEKPCFSNEGLCKNGRKKSQNNVQLNHCKEDGDLFDEEKFCKEYTCTCLLCQRKIKRLEKGVIVTINTHFSKGHHKLYVKPSMSLKGMMESVIFHNKPDEIEFISKSLPTEKNVKKVIRKNRKLDNNAKYVFRAKSCYFCVACMANIPSSDDFKIVMENFQNHFNSFEHQLCVEEKMKINRSINIDSKDNTIKMLLIERKELMERVKKRNANSKIKGQQKRLLLPNSRKIKLENHQEGTEK